MKGSNAFRGRQKLLVIPKSSFLNSTIMKSIFLSDTEISHTMRHFPSVNERLHLSLGMKVLTRIFHESIADLSKLDQAKQSQVCTKLLQGCEWHCSSKNSLWHVVTQHSTVNLPVTKSITVAMKPSRKSHLFYCPMG